MIAKKKNTITTTKKTSQVTINILLFLGAKEILNSLNIIHIYTKKKLGLTPDSCGI